MYTYKWNPISMDVKIQQINLYKKKKSYWGMIMGDMSGNYLKNLLNLYKYHFKCK